MNGVTTLHTVFTKSKILFKFVFNIGLRTTQLQDISDLQPTPDHHLRHVGNLKVGN